jgi:hypothetical protein
MPFMNSSFSRRQLLRCAVVAAAAAPLLPLISRSAFAADAPLVASDDPTAVAMHYTDDATKAADAKPGSKCANCALYTGAAGSTQGPCNLFGGKGVKAAGWCTAWAARP